MNSAKPNDRMFRSRVGLHPYCRASAIAPYPFARSLTSVADWPSMPCRQFYSKLFGPRRVATADK